jgi:hypothetical protein
MLMAKVWVNLTSSRGCRLPLEQQKVSTSLRGYEAVDVNVIVAVFHSASIEAI